MESKLVWERRVLPNGLTLLSYPRPSTFTAQVSAAVKYGSNDDACEKSGNAHFLEHLIAGGSKRRIEIHHEVEELGGASCFETNEEFTFCSMDVLPDKIVEASKVLSGLIFDPVFEDDKIELERKIILNEIAEARDDPIYTVEKMLVKSLFKRHPIRNETLGTRKTVDGLRKQDFVEAHENYFVPKNMILILTGNFADAGREKVIRDFQGDERKTEVLRRMRAVEDNKPREEVTVKRSGLTQAYLALGLRTAPVASDDTAALDLLESLLGAGESSRLFVELREKRGLTYDFEAANTTGSDYGYFSVNCAVKTESLGVTMAIIENQLKLIAETTPSQDELNKSRNLLLGKIYRTIDIPAALPRLLAFEEVRFGNENSLVDYIGKVNRLSGEDLAEAADRYFKPENYSTAVLTPKK